jgi:hypothetical protein
MNCHCPLKLYPRGPVVKSHDPTETTVLHVPHGVTEVGRIKMMSRVLNEQPQVNSELPVGHRVNPAEVRPDDIVVSVSRRVTKCDVVQQPGRQQEGQEWGLLLSPAAMKLYGCVEGSAAAECAGVRQCMGWVLTEVDGDAVRSPEEADAATEWRDEVRLRFCHPADAINDSFADQHSMWRLLRAIGLDEYADELSRQGLMTEQDFLYLQSPDDISAPVPHEVRVKLVAEARRIAVLRGARLGALRQRHHNRQDAVLPADCGLAAAQSSLPPALEEGGGRVHEGEPTDMVTDACEQQSVAGKDAGEQSQGGKPDVAAESLKEQNLCTGERQQLLQRQQQLTQAHEGKLKELQALTSQMQGVPHAEAAHLGIDKRVDEIRQVIPALVAEQAAIRSRLAVGDWPSDSEEDEDSEDEDDEPDVRGSLHAVQENTANCSGEQKSLCEVVLTRSSLETWMPTAAQNDREIASLGIAIKGGVSAPAIPRGGKVLSQSE